MAAAQPANFPATNGNAAMHLLLITPQLPYPPHQGTTIRNYNLIRELAARHTVDLLTFLAPGEKLDGPDADANPLHSLCRRIAATPQPVRTTRQRALDTLTSPKPDMAHRLDSPAMAALVADFAAGTPYDIIQVEGIEVAQYGFQARTITRRHQPGAALVFDDHNCEFLLQKRSALTDLRRPSRWIAAGYSLIQWQKLARYEVSICRQADGVVTVSAADAAALQAIVPDLDVTVVSNGIDLEHYSVYDKANPAADASHPNAAASSPRPGTPIPQTIVFTGKMDYRPNVDAVLWFADEVLPLIQARLGQVQFQIVGMNPHPRLDDLRRNPAILMTGAVPDTRPYIGEAGVYVIPMRVGGGTRFKALEAMAAGRPIVSTSLGVEGIPVTHGRELLLADTARAFADAVSLLLTASSDTAPQRAVMGQQARRFVEERYGWSQIVPTLDALYKRLRATA